MSSDQAPTAQPRPSPNPRLIRHVAKPKSKVLFLGYSERQTDLIGDLVALECEVWHTEDKITSTAGYDLVVSYGYKHILKKDAIASSAAPIVNLHISYLPWNRGAHPNFWSFYDATPSGVSIHLIDDGVDTGPIIYQERVVFAEEEKTFSKTYRRLITEIEALFKSHIADIATKNFFAVPQTGAGSYHRVADLPTEFSGWDSEIQTEMARLRNILPPG